MDLINVFRGSKTMKKISAIAVASLSILFAASAMSASGNFAGNVTKIYATPNNKWGGCMVRTSANYSRLNCNANWISLDCEGVVEGHSKSAGQRAFDVATVAMLTGTKAKFRIYDNIKINGYCFADRVDLNAPAAAQ